MQQLRRVMHIWSRLFGEFGNRIRDITLIIFQIGLTLFIVLIHLQLLSCQGTFTKIVYDYSLIQRKCNPLGFSRLIVNLNRIHKHTKITQPILGGLSDSFKIVPSNGYQVFFQWRQGVRFETLIKCLLYWSIIASDKSRLRLNFVSFHQHGIRWVLRMVSFQWVYDNAVEILIS